MEKKREGGRRKARKEGKRKTWREKGGEKRGVFPTPEESLSRMEVAVIF